MDKKSQLQNNQSKTKTKTGAANKTKEHVKQKWI